MERVSWGPLAHPIRTDSPERQDIPWRDNGYLGFWDVEKRVIGACHFSTSPDPVPNRKISFHLKVDGKSIDILQEVGVATTETDTIKFDLEGRIEVDHPQVRAFIDSPPLLPAGVYGDIIPTLGQTDHPFHAEGGGVMTGWVEVDGSRTEIAGNSFRDRTSGFRNDADTFPEYILLMATLDGLNLAVINMLAPNGAVKTQGFAIEADKTTNVTDLKMVRTGIGRFHQLTVTLEDGREFTLHSEGHLGDLWIPIGPPSPHPVLSVLEEFHVLGTDAGISGSGIVEQGITRKTGTIPTATAHLA